MTLWLDGKFWGAYFKRSYIPEIESLRDVQLNNMLTALPDAEREAEAHTQSMWDWAMAQPSDGSDDPGDWAEWVQEQGLIHYQRLSGVRQAAFNMGTVMLWHLLEQQMLSFHRRQVLSIQEEQDTLEDPKKHNALHTFKEFKKRLEEGGYGLSLLSAWNKVDELRLVANTVKHGAGDSASKLLAVRPDLFTAPGLGDFSARFAPRAVDVERPAAGEDLYVSENDLRAYFTAAVDFWTDFAEMIAR